MEALQEYLPHNQIMYFASYLLNQTLNHRKCDVYPYVVMDKDYNDTMHNILKNTGGSGDHFAITP